jgi:serine/threonine-protein phosphatase PGAM5
MNSKKYRIVVIVRHGNYDRSGPNPDQGRLTALGRRQARLAGRALADLKFDQIIASTLPRAWETAEILCKEFKRAPKIQPSRLLWECLPSVDARHREELSDWVRKNYRKLAPAGDRASSAAFRKYFRRPTRAKHLDLLVCHGNILRSFIVRALGVDPKTWSRLDILQCGISVVQISRDGRMKVLAHNDCGHIPRHRRSFL